MRTSLATLCGNFIENRDIVKSVFSWESSYLYPVCAAIFTDKRMKADPARLEYCKNLLKAQTGVFSNFRSTAKLAMISMLAVDKEPEEKLRKALGVYDELKGYFWGSQYLPVASMIIANMVEPVRYQEVTARTRHIYDLMKSEHPFLTSSEDSVFAAMLALSSLTDEQIVEETEKCYRLIKPEFFSGNAVQSLSHVLALGEGRAEDKCRATIELFCNLKARGYKYGTDYELATLGILALLPTDSDTIMTDIMEVDDFLSTQKGYGFFGIGRKQRIMHAGMIVASDYTGQSDAMHTAAIGGTISLIAAQQAAMCAAIAASSAAAASAGSSGGC
ncbi:MAG: DUF4003 family protein [Oliverpabstia sp.]